MQISKLDIRSTDYDSLDKILKEKGYKAYREAQQRMFKPSMIYVWPEGESIYENLQNRRQRPYTVYKKEVLPQVFRAMGLPSYTKARWSQKAGCPCGCSPAFIIDSVNGTDVHVTIS